LQANSVVIRRTPLHSFNSHFHSSTTLLSQFCTPTTTSFGTLLSYIHFARTPRKTACIVDKACSPRRCPAIRSPTVPRVCFCGNVFSEPLPSNGHGADHIESNSCNTFSIVACAYFGRCLAMGLHAMICNDFTAMSRHSGIRYLHFLRTILMVILSGLGKDISYISDILTTSLSLGRVKVRNVMSPVRCIMTRLSDLPLFDSCEFCDSGSNKESRETPSSAHSQREFRVCLKVLFQLQNLYGVEIYIIIWKGCERRGLYRIFTCHLLGATGGNCEIFYHW
jgi:hypothetical protein